MKLALSWFCILHLAAVIISAGIVNPNDPKAAHRNVSSSSGKARSPQSAGSLNHSRHRPLFARRGQYERQRIHNPKPKEAPALPNNLPPPPPKVAAKPVKPSCSQLTQSCVPQGGCCDPCASCHCRFFNAICFCRRTTS